MQDSLNYNILQISHSWIFVCGQKPIEATNYPVISAHFQVYGKYWGKSAATIFNNKIELFERLKARVQAFLGY